ncbi:ZIP zinc/iron transport family [Aureobasidium pullulans]|uniref:ZIP zinc/iron transport family n=1 Tax=Aureobasidium pullulans TaxID=5580 RepID=A0A4S9LHM4_AURPU|nr:ZIP zinc/iron transport family [Aureobasidium pullulans]THY28987.1 ZIP zinc/iron transport family [Aureobasidium pullulans]
MSTCQADNDYDGRMGVRISAIFVIGVSSLFATWFPVFAARHRGVGVPEWAFFIAKYFGSGVIIATAFIHLLAPAHEALDDECLTGPIKDYSWVEGIVLMTIFVLFFVELMTMRYAKFGHSHSHGHDDELENHDDLGIKPEPFTDSKKPETVDESEPAFELPPRVSTSTANCPTTPHARGDDHLGHARSHIDNEMTAGWTEVQKQAAGVFGEDYAAQMTALFILEFGVIFHSIFIGLTLAVSGDEFTTLYVVLVFHQSFEGLGLGTRLAAVQWPKSKRWSPYLLGAGYAISTPIAIAIGLGVRQSFAPGSQTTLIANGVFDSISAGILIYTGLVELMAHEFMFSTYMQRANIKTVLTAFFVMCLGAGLMALLGKWA